MSEPMDRLRRLQSLRAKSSRSRTDRPTPPPAGRPQPEIAQQQATAITTGTAPTHLLDGEIVATPAGECYLVTVRYPLSTPRGPHALGRLLEMDPDVFAAHHPQFGLHHRLDFTQAAFIDTETTGLGGGAGIYAFMIGVGTFEQRSDGRDFEFVVRQYFMRSPAEEAALLVAVTERLSRYAMTVTFNGRTFDLPLLRARLHYNGWAPALDEDGAALLAPDRPHLDLLHPARRLWRKRLGSCRLINLEEQILALHRSTDDVPGHLIPQLYVEYVRSGNAADVNRIFYHNHEDIVSMVGVAERLAHIFGTRLDDLDPNDLAGEDWTALGELYQTDARIGDAERAYLLALDLVQDPDGLSRLFLRLGQLQKQTGRWQDAVATWQRWISTVPGPDPTPYVELAKFCEWRDKDYEQAAMWTGWALHNLQQAVNLDQTRRRTQIAELEHRLARLQRKLEA